MMYSESPNGMLRLLIVNTRCFIKGISTKKSDFYVLRNKTQNNKTLNCKDTWHVRAP